MKLTWHIVAKDLRRLMGLLALWLAMYVAEFAIGARLLSGAVHSVTTFQAYQGVDGILTTLRFAIGYLLVAMLVFEDPLVGNTAFWPTRPISGARLLGAKVLTCALAFGALPVLVCLPWWAYCGYGGGEILSAAGITLKLQAGSVALGLLIASLTGVLSRYIGWTVLLVIGSVLVFTTLMKHALSANHLYFHGMDQVVSSSPDQARFHLLNWLALGTCAAVVLHQFLTRRLARSLAILAGILALLAVEVTWWPIDPPAPLGVAAAPAMADLAGHVDVRLKDDLRLHVEGDKSDTSNAYFFGSFAVDHTTPEMLLRFEPPTLEWRWPDGRISREQGTLVNTGVPAGSVYQVESVVPHKDPSESAWEKTSTYKTMLTYGKPMTYEQMHRRPPADGMWDFYVEVPRADGLRMLADPSVFTLDLPGEYLKPRLEAEVSMQRGAAWSGGSQGFRIADARWNDVDKWFTLEVVEHRSELGRSPFQPFPYSGSIGRGSSYVAINRQEGESAETFQLNNYAVTVDIATVAIQLRQITFVGPSNRIMGQLPREKGVWVGPDFKEWFTHASLGLVTEVPDGSFSRKVTVEPFTVSLDGFSKAP
jgi:hypothetical protein